MAAEWRKLNDKSSPHIVSHIENVWSPPAPAGKDLALLDAKRSDMLLTLFLTELKTAAGVKILFDDKRMKEKT